MKKKVYLANDGLWVEVKRIRSGKWVDWVDSGGRILSYYVTQDGRIIFTFITGPTIVGASDKEIFARPRWAPAWKR